MQAYWNYKQLEKIFEPSTQPKKLAYSLKIRMRLEDHKVTFYLQ